jgi:Holliday junction resolvase RusA-like endonuclease
MKYPNHETELMRLLSFHIPFAPVSQQASGAAKSDLKSVVRKVISGTDFFLTGEVRLNLDWRIHDRIRYETDTAPDIDNILKPTIDALTGPDGVLLDDCQIQRVNCGWIDWNKDEQAFDIELEYFEDELIPSRNIIFVQFNNGLCFPFAKDLPEDITAELVAHLVKRLETRDRIVSLTDSYHAGLYIMPIQRFFHRSRVRGFAVIEHKKILKRHSKNAG